MDELGHLGWVAHQSYEIEGRLFGIRTDSTVFARWLADTLPATIVRDEKAHPNYSIVIGQADGGPGRRFHIVYRDATPLIRTFDVAEVVRVLWADIESLASGQRSDAVYLQAMFLHSNGVHALFPEELVGSLGYVRRRVDTMGLHLPTSRSVAVDVDSGEVVPVPHLLEVEDAALRDLARRVPSQPTARARTSLDRRTTIDLVCTMGSPSSESVQPVSRGFALYVLASNATNLSVVGAAGLMALQSLVEKASCWEIAAREPRLMLESVLELVHPIEYDSVERSASRRT